MKRSFTIVSAGLLVACLFACFSQDAEARYGRRYGCGRQYGNYGSGYLVYRRVTYGNGCCNNAYNNGYYNGNQNYGNRYNGNRYYGNQYNGNQYYGNNNCGQNNYASYQQSGVTNACCNTQTAYYGAAVTSTVIAGDSVTAPAPQPQIENGINRVSSPAPTPAN